MAPWWRIQATATEVSSPPEKAMPTRSPTGRLDRTLDTAERYRHRRRWHESAPSMSRDRNTSPLPLGYTPSPHPLRRDHVILIDHGILIDQSIWEGSVRPFADGRT